MFTKQLEFNALDTKIEALGVLAQEFAVREGGLSFALVLTAIKLDLEKLQEAYAGAGDHETVN